MRKIKTLTVLSKEEFYPEEGIKQAIEEATENIVADINNAIKKHDWLKNESCFVYIDETLPRAIGLKAVKNAIILCEKKGWTCTNCYSGAGPIFISIE